VSFILQRKPLNRALIMFKSVTKSVTLSNYAPDQGRVTNGDIELQVNAIQQNKQLVNFLEAISQMVIILNKYRQIVYANKSYKDFISHLNHDTIIGKRPGETFNCINAFNSEYGCGSSLNCKSCGALNAILNSEIGVKSTKDCQILTADNDALDLEVTATPLEMEGETLTIFSIIDVCAEKRRRSLERVFIHDILNSAGGISGLSSILKEVDDRESIVEIAGIIETAANNLVEEIKTQREIGAAERGDLIPEISSVESSSVLIQLASIYSGHSVSEEKTISIHPESLNCKFYTDPVLLKRILGNMIKNAQEVNQTDDEITLKCECIGSKARFSVHNKSFIPDDIKHQLFKRFFSTKGKARGIGTYSMKLLGEKYLNGKVWFESEADRGTTFYFEL